MRSAPVPVTAEELLTSQPLHEAIFRDAAESHMPVAMAALRFLGECTAYNPCLRLRTPLWPLRQSGLLSVLQNGMQGIYDVKPSVMLAAWTGLQSSEGFDVMA